jgi:5'-deoxynucleotidase YfbR-like HD superfamily hydrolase
MQETKQKEIRDWEERLYFEVLEDLLFHQKMLPHHRNQQEGMEEIREDIKKLNKFISTLLAERDAEVKEMIKKLDSECGYLQDSAEEFGYSEACRDIINKLDGK